MDWDSHKIPIIGDANVGKTSIVTRYTTGAFGTEPAATVGVSNVQVVLRYQGDELPVNIWDTAGQERFRSLVPLYTRGADIVVLVFAVNDNETFDHLDQWFIKVRNDMRLSCPLVLCGNKSDLEFSIPRVRAEEWANEHGCPLVFTSAATGQSIEELFDVVAAELFKANSHINVSERVTEPVQETNRGCC
jgi:small GTP-binding protein